MERKLITLLTDFGTKDPYAGIMKGVIFGINPDAQVIDLSHGIPRQDLLAAALVLWASVPYFPRGTIHVAVVDPEVGTKRRALLLQAEGSYFIGPDNGILSLAVAGKKTEKIVDLTNEVFHLGPKSRTFHGRDIFAPVAAYLSLGIPPGDFGPAAQDFVRLPWPEVIKGERAIEGEVIYIDSFGNLVTNIQRRDLESLEIERLRITLGEVTICGVARNYAAGASPFVALINSWDLLEISVFKGSAQLERRAKIGDRVRVEVS